jgi:hypothetical protein
MGPMRVVVEHPDWGLFLGQNHGKPYWSEKLITVNITEVVTFEDHHQAEMYCAANMSSEYEYLIYHTLEIDSAYATIKDLVDAGLVHRADKLLFYTRAAGYA